MGEISSELRQFREAVTESQLGTMTSMCQTVQEKVKSLGENTTSAKNVIESSYSSENKNIVIRRLDKMDTIYSKIIASVGGDLTGLITQAKSLINYIVELEETNKKIEAQEAKIKNASSSTDPESLNTVSSARSEITRLNKIFDETHEIATKKLASLKSWDSQISFVQEFSSSNTEIDPNDLQYGTFELHSFTGSNGKVVEYYLYVPDYGKDVKGLPAMLYMHGGGTNMNLKASDALKYGLSNYIANKTITPSGIVIIPAIKDFHENEIGILKELTDHVVEEYDVDTNRISLGGHSYGGITAFRLVNQNPGYFSSVVALSGSDKVTNAFNGVKVWEFGGYYETSKSLTSIFHSQRTTDEVNEVGGEATLTTLHTGHTGTNKQVFANEYMSPDGIVENPLEWALRQVKS